MPVYGINLDPDNPKGLPAPPIAGIRFQELQGLKWARIVFQATPHKPRTVDQSCVFYDSLVNDLSAVGIGTLFILGHQAFVGNAPWTNNGNWQPYTSAFSAVCGKIAAHFKGKKVAYEIWNEGDQASPSAIFVDPTVFAPVLKAASDAIKANDPAATVVFGGLVSANPVAYLKTVQAKLGGQMPVDAIGIHPYGQGPTGDNNIITFLSKVTDAYPTLPVWITEIGDDAITPDRYDTLAFYMRQINKVLNSQLPTRVPVLVWYCWSDGMNKSFGIVDENLAKKRNVYSTFFELARAGAPPVITFTHQDLINAVMKASQATGGSMWQWFKDAGLNYIFADRSQVYIGKPIDELPNLTQTQKDLIKLALAKQPLPITSLNTPTPPEAGAPGAAASPGIQPKILEIGWISQMDQSGHGNNDCGDASVLTLLRYYKCPAPSSEEVFSQFSGKTNGDNLIALAGDYHLTLTSKSGPNPELIGLLSGLIDGNKPAILLVNYDDLMFPVHLISGADQGMHWFVVVGYADDVFYVHDPLWLPTQRDGKGGAFLQIHRDTLQNALRGVMLYKAD
jgi:putative glycosyl hydrolase